MAWMHMLPGGQSCLHAAGLGLANADGARPARRHAALVHAPCAMAAGAKNADTASLQVVEALELSPLQVFKNGMHAIPCMQPWMW